MSLGPRPGGRRQGSGIGGEASGFRQVSLARLKEFGISPKRDLGQNFLIDDNIVGVILGLLECRPDDVVLEVGAGLGVLTGALARVARHVQAFEVDRSLEAALSATLQDDPNVALHFQDVLAVAAAVALGAANEDVAQELHFDLLEPGAAAPLALPLAGVEAERAGVQAPLPGQLRLREERPNVVKRPDIHRRVRPRCLAENGLVH